MSYPIIVNRANLNLPLAYLNNIQNDSCEISKAINGEDKLTFTAIIEELKSDFLYDESNLILVDNDLYKPLTLTEEHHDNGLLTISVDCEHISYELLNKIMPDFSYSYKDIVTVINQCLLGTDFVLAGTDVTLKTDIAYTQECNARQILIAIAKDWRAELKFEKYNIYAYKQIGANRGVDFRFGKNLKAVKRNVDRANRDKNGNPSVSYAVDVVNLALLGGDYTDLEYFELGDTVRIIDEALNLETYQRIVSLKKDVLTGKNTSLTLGAPKNDLRQTITGIQNNIDYVAKDVGIVADDVNKVSNNLDNLNGVVDEISKVINDSAPDWNMIKNITDNLGNVIAAKVSGTLKTSSAQIQNSTTTMEITDNGILFHNQPTEAASTFACLINSTGVLFANQKNANGTWKWQTAIGAEGVTATKILAAALYGMTIEGVTITAGTINGGTVNGATMEGSTMYAGDRRSGTYVAITNLGQIYGYNNNNLIFDFKANNADGFLRLSNISNSDYIDIVSRREYQIGSNTLAAPAVWTNAGRLLIGGNNAYEIRFLLKNKPSLIISDTGVEINGDLTVNGNFNHN